MKFYASIVAGLVVLLLLSKPVVERFRPDYMQIAARTAWAWSEDRETAADCAARVAAGGVYRVESAGDEMAVSFVVDRGNRHVYQWVGHDYTVFVIVGNRLYYADFSPADCGGNIVAVDLATGSRIWREPLLAVGFWDHSKYANTMNLEADNRTLRVFGNESCGRYVEIKDITTGRTLGHHAFDRMGTVPLLWRVRPPGQDGGPARLLWLVRGTLLLLALSCIVARRLVRSHRARDVRARRLLARGCCVSCGYDLRASTERCPECGSIRRTSIGDV